MMATWVGMPSAACSRAYGIADALASPLMAILRCRSN
jgi:hypothetical protein